jgi:hypothetical protein
MGDWLCLSNSQGAREDRLGSGTNIKSSVCMYWFKMPLQHSEGVVDRQLAIPVFVSEKSQGGSFVLSLISLCCLGWSGASGFQWSSWLSLASSWGL